MRSPSRGRLLSVNVGLPREVEWQGKTVRTAIWKEPVDGARMVRRINIDGDQADRRAHGGEHRAVFVYQVDELLRSLADSHRLVAYSQPASTETPGADHDISGRLDLTVLEQAGIPKEADYYLCGPDGFMRAVGAALAARGVAPERIATEVFGAVATHASGIVKAGDRAPHPPDGPPGSGPIVSFSRSNLAVAWDDRYPSLLDLAEACDVQVGFGCRNGTCHNCESGLLAGEVTYHIEPLEPPPDGRVLVCSTRPSSELTLDL